MHRVLERQLRRLGIGAAPPTEEQWRKFLDRVDRAYVEADQDRYTLERALELSSNEMRKRFTELRSAQQELVNASRRAGMADVATSVLHDIGNVLNSVNVSASLAADLVKTSRRDGLAKSLALLAGQPAPGKFLDEDPRGKKLLTYLGAVSEALASERTTTLAELTSVTKHIEHIKAIVAQQLAIARGGGQAARIREQVNLVEITNDAVGVLRSTFAAGAGVDVIFERETIVIETDRHKLFQILMNLLTNARDALAGRQGKITVRTRRLADGRVALEVADDGVGIPAAELDRIFVHGFTTKPQGHGFGLHSSACAAVELGGTLTAVSGGKDRGATFTITLPTVRPAAAKPSSSARPGDRPSRPPERPSHPSMKPPVLLEASPR